MKAVMFLFSFVLISQCYSAPRYSAPHKVVVDTRALVAKSDDKVLQNASLKTGRWSFCQKKVMLGFALTLMLSAGAYAWISSQNKDPHKDPRYIPERPDDVKVALNMQVQEWRNAGYILPHGAEDMTFTELARIVNRQYEDNSDAAAQLHHGGDVYEMNEQRILQRVLVMSQKEHDELTVKQLANHRKESRVDYPKLNSVGQLPADVVKNLKLPVPFAPLKNEDVFEKMKPQLESVCYTGHECATSIILPCGHIICSECEKSLPAVHQKDALGKIQATYTACPCCRKRYNEGWMVKIAPTSEGYTE